jgi:hypothetical protein
MTAPLSNNLVDQFPGMYGFPPVESSSQLRGNRITDLDDPEATFETTTVGVEALSKVDLDELDAILTAFQPPFMELDLHLPTDTVAIPLVTESNAGLGRSRVVCPSSQNRDSNSRVFNQEDKPKRCIPLEALTYHNSKRHNREGTIFGNNKAGRTGKLSCDQCRRRRRPVPLTFLD